MTKAKNSQRVSQNRSAIMRAVKSKNTTPEILVRKILSQSGYRYRLHSKTLPGSPDIVFPGRKKAIFVHGCFWHGHDCKRGARVPRSNRLYWISKIQRNQARDLRHLTDLKRAGWKVKIIWECELRDPALAKKLVRFVGDKRVTAAQTT
jgi:DNA mismatch endonuclease (patch repair protein)